MKTIRRAVAVVVQTEKNGRPVTALAVPAHPQLALFEFDHPYDAGWVRVTSVGSENVYFDWQDDSGVIRKGFSKCL